MANIRFVKPLKDNRIRSLPGVLMYNDVMAINSVPPSDVVCISTPKIDNIIHITTPKRKTGNMASTDIFITSRNNSCQSNIVSSSPTLYDHTFNNSGGELTNNMGLTNANFNISREQSNQNGSADFSSEGTKSLLSEYMNSNLNNSVSLSDQDQNANVSSTTEKNDNHFESTYENNYGKSNTGYIVPEKTQYYSDISEKAAFIEKDYEKMTNYGQASEEISDVFQVFEETYINDIQCEDNTDQALSSSGIPKYKGQSKRPILKCCNTFGTVSDSGLSDVLDEEIERLPEVSQPGSVTVSNICQKIQQQQQSASLSSSQHQQNRHAPCLFDNGTINKPNGSGRLIHRSISDAGMVSNSKAPSFFKSINDAKYYGFDGEDPLDIEDMSTGLVEIDHSEHRKFSQSAKIAWDTGIPNYRPVNTQDITEGKKATKSGVNHVMMSRSLSGDSALTDRLRIRRCALADPENMIMRQDVREKIEKEVEKRRSSMVRKISQFFNVHLGLNKEEDLI